MDYTTIALSALARYHALGIALRIKNPELFEEAKQIIDIYPYEKTTMFRNLADFFYEDICKDPRISKYKDRIKKTMDANRDLDYFHNVEKVEPWISITHGDYWVNNLMFSHDG